MRRLSLICCVLALLALLAVWSARWWWPQPSIDLTEVDRSQVSAERGKALAYAAGCVSCHRSEDAGDSLLSGGRWLPSPFGDFYVPNISPSPQGIGGWDEVQFVRAVRHGRRADGRWNFPALPWTSYRRMKTEDVLSIKAWIDSQPGDAQPNQPHRAVWFANRDLLAGWVMLLQSPAPLGDDRGQYLVEVLGHCGECHSPRNLLGLPSGSALTGNPNGGEGESVPPIDANTLHNEGWTEDDLIWFLQDGGQLDGDFVGGSMGHVIDDITARLSEDDQRAVARWLLARPAP
ncbi:cytochrome c [Gammaproteobacteria bacterium]|nr:cytochrome c [Gammaproteobacteria bacterium]